MPDYLDSDYDIDKIVDAGTISIVNSGATTQAPQTSHIVQDTIPNIYGDKVFARARWSVDGGDNWQNLKTRLVYNFTLTFTPGPSDSTLSGLQAAISIGANESTIYFVTANGYHGNVSDDGATYTYTPTSQTFLIEYTLFEVE